MEDAKVDSYKSKYVNKESTFINQAVLCKSCDHIILLSSNSPHEKLICPVCNRSLSYQKKSLKDTALVAISALLLLFIAIFQPFLSVSSLGINNTINLASIFTILKLDWSFLLYIFLLFSFIFPIIMLAITFYVGFLNLKPSRILAKIYSISHQFCMVDVFILGVLVSLIKLTSLAQVQFHIGFLLVMIFSILLVWCYIQLPPYRVWDLYMQNKELSLNLIGKRGIDVNLVVCRHCGMVLTEDEIKEGHCSRCHAYVSIRHKAYRQKTIALLLSALILYLPSNLYPIMFTEYLGVNIGSNIIDGVISLWNMQSYFVALVILFASIFIPIFKIISIAFLLYLVKYRRISRPKRFQFLYRLIAFIGKWSMIDVFVVIIMTSVVRFTGILMINPGFAIITFCIVVIITIFAAESFDERVIWDNYKDGQ